MTLAVMSPSEYDDPRAHALREQYLSRFGGEEIPVPVESIAEDLLGLAVEAVDDLECSGMLLPSERRIPLSAATYRNGDPIGVPRVPLDGPTQLPTELMSSTPFTVSVVG